MYTKPIYDGFTILDLSKLFMYEFYYEKLYNYWGENVILHYMDTDSFVLTIKTDDLVKDLHHFRDDFDFSNLNRDHELYSNENKKVIGKMKIETGPELEERYFDK